MRIPRFIRHHLTLLQLEQYELGRYLRVASARYAPLKSPRQEAVWTMKMRVITGIATVLVIVTAGISYALYGIAGGAIALAACYALLPLILALATLIVWPIDRIGKNMIIRKARKKIARFPNLKIIGITGSYGKTTMKEAVAAILKEKYEVLSSPASVNTPVGIARLIGEKLTEKTEIFVVEMGAYEQGDIREVCGITPPNIAMVTGINEAHLERFGSIERTKAAKFEIADCAKPGATLVLNADDKRVREEYGRHSAGKKVAFYSASKNPLAKYETANIGWSKDGLETSFELKDKDGVKYRLSVPLVGGYAPGTVAGAVEVAERCGMTEEEVARGAAMIRPIPHRLEPFMASGNVLVIDDSYNGNADGAREAMRVLARFPDRRKIYCTPGLVETGSATHAVHEGLGMQLAGIADIVILIENEATKSMRRGLEAGGFAKEMIMTFETGNAAHAALPGILRDGDVILFQNDWPDNYF